MEDNKEKLSSVNKQEGVDSKTDSVAEQKEKEMKLAERVIRGHNDVFKKDYNIKELGLEFTIGIRFPNAIEQARIQARAERYLDGLGTLMSPSILQSYRMLATIRECGTYIPGFLEKDEEIYNLQILNIISSDFIAWMDTFRY